MTSYSKQSNKRFSYYETYDFWNYLSGQEPVQVSTFNVEFPYGRDFSGDDLPGWKNIIEKQGDAQNAAAGTRTTVNFKPTEGSYTVSQYANIGSPPSRQLAQLEVTRSRTLVVSCSTPATSAIAVSTAQDQAKAKFVSEARRAMTKVQAGPFIVELGKTLRMIKSPADAIRKRLDSYLKDVKKRTRGMSKASEKKKNAVVANTWLEYTFGWTPLIYDTMGGAEALASLVARPPPLVYVRGSGKSSRQIGQSTVTAAATGGNVKFQAVTTEDAVCNMYGQVITIVDPFPAFRGAFGLRAHDFLPTIWELIPYSFVVDYFTNIGDIISCATFSTSNLHWWGRSTKAKRTSFTTRAYFSSNLPANTSSTTYSRSLTPGSMRRTYEEFNRDRTPSLVPSLRFGIPGMRQSFNIGALVAQARSTRI